MALHLALYCTCVWLLLFNCRTLEGLLEADVSIDQIKPTVAAIYVFGDSTVDVGTNNHVPECGAIANFPKNGVDFPGAIPTGRFSNGYNSVDVLAELLGFKESPPPYLLLLKNARRGYMRNVLNGANFGSGGAGILGITGKRPYKRVMSLAEQIQQFATVHRAIAKVLGSDEKARQRISQSLFLISVGSNDIFEHFLFDKIPPKGDPFLNTLFSTYTNHLRSLIRFGAKRIAIVGVSPIGCVPKVRAATPDFRCSDLLNAYAKQFNAKLEALMKKLSLESGNRIKYGVAKSYDMTLNVINDPAAYGFADGKSACCGGGAKLNAEKPCLPDSKVCRNRESHLFWDQYHPSETAYKIAAYALFYGQTHHIAPLNISQLAVVKL